MKNVPDYILKELVRLLPVLIDNIDVDGRNTRLYNAVRLVKILIKNVWNYHQSSEECGNEFT